MSHAEISHADVPNMYNNKEQLVSMKSSKWFPTNFKTSELRWLGSVADYVFELVWGCQQHGCALWYFVFLTLVDPLPTCLTKEAGQAAKKHDRGPTGLLARSTKSHGSLDSAPRENSWELHSSQLQELQSKSSTFSSENQKSYLNCKFGFPSGDTWDNFSQSQPCYPSTVL